MSDDRDAAPSADCYKLFTGKCVPKRGVYTSPRRSRHETWGDRGRRPIDEPYVLADGREVAVYLPFRPDWRLLCSAVQAADEAMQRAHPPDGQARRTHDVQVAARDALAALRVIVVAHSDAPKDISPRDQIGLSLAIVQSWPIFIGIYRDLRLQYQNVLAWLTGEFPELRGPIERTTGSAGGDAAATADEQADRQPPDRLDETAVADALAANGRNLEAAFVRHFKDRQSTTWQELVDAVCPGQEREWGTVRTWTNRVHNALMDLRPPCRLRFRTANREYLVRKFDPAE
jgi:hypothetical protein